MVLLSVAPAGCVTEHTIPTDSPEHLVVLELPATPGPGSLGRVLHAKHASLVASTLSTDRERIRQALDTELRRSLPSSTCPPTHIDFVPLDEPKASAIGRPLDAATLAGLQASLPADSYLRVRVTDYGETPRRWEAAYIGFEVVSTLAIAAALYVHRLTRPVAAAYLAEESIEEISEGYAGFWTLNRLSRPVRIEADWIAGRSGEVLWSDAHTGLAAWRWKNLRHVDDATRDVLLDASTRKAVEALARSLEQHGSGSCPDRAPEGRHQP